LATDGTLCALYDACVLYPAPLRDILMQLASSGLVRARWSVGIHDEWMRSLRANRPDIPIAKIARIRKLMDAHAPDALVEDFEDLTPTLELPDENDRHVLSAAIRAHAQVLVTNNLRDFPAHALEPHGIEAQHPDEFLCSVLNVAPTAGRHAFRQVRARLHNPVVGVGPYLEVLRKLRLVETAKKLAVGGCRVPL
jgi:hypothetical protein